MSELPNRRHLSFHNPSSSARYLHLRDTLKKMNSARKREVRTYGFSRKIPFAIFHSCVFNRLRDFTAALDV